MSDHPNKSVGVEPVQYDVQILPDKLVDGLWECIEGGAEEENLIERIRCVIKTIVGERHRKKVLRRKG